MKITIERSRPCNSDGEMDPESVQHSVSVEHPSDDMCADYVVRLLYWAMLACSYHPSSLQSAFYDIAIEQGYEPESLRKNDESN